MAGKGELIYSLLPPFLRAAPDASRNTDVKPCTRDTGLGESLETKPAAQLCH